MHARRICSTCNTSIIGLPVVTTPMSLIRFGSKNHDQTDHMVTRIPIKPPPRIVCAEGEEQGGGAFDDEVSEDTRGDKETVSQKEDGAQCGDGARGYVVVVMVVCGGVWWCVVVCGGVCCVCCVCCVCGVCGGGGSAPFAARPTKPAHGRTEP